MGTYTGRNMFKDITGAMNMIKNDWQLTQQCTGYNSEMLSVAEQFKRERQEWITKGGAVGDAAPLTVTQTLWHSIYLEIKRLKRLGIEVTYKALQQIRHYKKDNAAYSYFNYRHDGRNLLCKVTQRLHIEKHYTKEGKRIRKDKRDMTASFYISWARTPRGTYVCPNCGNESILETFLDGCDYCGSKFHIEAFNKKVASFYLTEDRMADSREVNHAGEVIKYFCVAAMSFMMITILPIFFFISIPVFIFSAAKCVMLGINNDRKGAGRNTMTKLDIREHIPDFSVESFISSVDNKIKSLHFAERESEVKAFCLCPVGSVLEKYENIAICDNGRYLLKGFQFDEKNGLYHMAVEMDLQLTELLENKMKSRKEHVKVTLSKRVTANADLENDAKMFRCYHCGSTVSLVEGGICKYCNTPIEMINHDWVITGYETDW